MKKIKLTKLDEELRSTKEKFLKGMKEYKGERLNNEGLSENATLYITLYEAKDLKPLNYSGSSDPYAIFILEGKKAMSSFKPETLDPVWNEDFTFLVTRRDAVLKLEIYSKKEFGGDALAGEMHIDLKSLEHQHKTESWYDLVINKDPNGNGSVRLRLQYIYSRYKYYSDNYSKTEMQIIRLQEDINELNRYFESFEKPYGIILAGEIDAIIEKRILERSEDIAEYMASTRKSIYASPRGAWKMGVAQKVENIFKSAFSKHI